MVAQGTRPASRCRDAPSPIACSLFRRNAPAWWQSHLSRLILDMRLGKEATGADCVQSN
jgi:hypothetical protein